MKSTFALLAFAVGALAQGVTQAIAPSATAPAGCSPTYPGTFEITVVNVTSSQKRSLAERQNSGVLTLTLAGGKLTDMAGRTGYIASNYQFQFDKPPQTGAIYTSGFSVCGNGSLALGGSAIFYQCLSGGFFNLYDRSWAAQCSPIYLVAMGAGSVSASSDGQIGATTIATGAVSVKSEGQPVGTTVLPVTQISDGQIQKPTAIPVSQLSDGQRMSPIPCTFPTSTNLILTTAQGPTGVPVSQATDGQIIASTIATSAVPVSQATDGQIIASTMATSAVPVSQATDGQIIASTIATSGVPVSVKSDGQPVATSAVAPVSVKSDGQPVATPVSTTVVAVLSIQSDGQPIATAASNGTVTTAAPAQFTGGASSQAFGLGAVAAGVIGFVAML